MQMLIGPDTCDVHKPPSQGKSQTFDLGEGPDGWEVARRAREINASVPIIYTSGDSAHDHAVRGVPDGMMLQKPFALAQLVTAISTLLNEARSQPQ